MYILNIIIRLLIEIYDRLSKYNIINKWAT